MVQMLVRSSSLMRGQQALRLRLLQPIMVEYLVWVVLAVLALQIWGQLATLLLRVQAALRQ
jgi:hypothetical protein